MAGFTMSTAPRSYYLAIADKYADEEVKGEVQYKPLSAPEFRSLTSTRQLMEFAKLGITANSESELLAKLIPAEVEPSCTPYQLPPIHDLPLLDIIRHISYIQRHIKTHLKTRSKLLRTASLSAHSLQPLTSTHTETLRHVRELTTTLDHDRQALQKLMTRKSKILKSLKKRPAPTLYLPSSILDSIASPNPYALLDDSPPNSPGCNDVHRDTNNMHMSPPLPPLSPHSDSTGDWIYPRAKRQFPKRQPAPKKAEPSPIQVALQHAHDMRNANLDLPSPINPELPHNTFEIIGGYKDSHAANVIIICLIKCYTKDNNP